MITAIKFTKSFSTGKAEETTGEYVSEMLIEFAKIHVEKALKAVYESNEEILDKTIVFNAYPLNLIK